MQGITRSNNRRRWARLIATAAATLTVILGSGSSDVGCSGPTVSSKSSKSVAGNGSKPQEVAGGRMDNGKLTIYYRKADGERHRAIEVIALKNKRASDKAVLRVWNLLPTASDVEVKTATRIAYSGRLDSDKVAWIVTSCSDGKLALAVSATVTSTGDQKVEQVFGSQKVRC